MPGLGGFATYALERLSKILSEMRIQYLDPKRTEGSVIENQVAVLKVIAQQPGSVIPYVDPPRAGNKPIRFRTVRRLVELDQLGIRQSDLNNSLYLFLTARGWERITVKLDV